MSILEASIRRKLKLILVIISIAGFFLIVTIKNVNNMNNIKNGNFKTPNSEIGSNANNQIYVGYSKVCINPNPDDGPVPLAGYGNTYDRLARFEDNEQEFQQDLYTTAVALKDSNENIVIFVTCDLVSVPDAICNSIRSSVENVLHIEAKRIMISCTHTHSAPDVAFSNTNYPELNASIVKYTQLLTDKILMACGEATNSFKQASTYVKSIDIVGDNEKNKLNFVRHYETDCFYQDGTRVYNSSNHGGSYWEQGVIKTAASTRHLSNADSTMQLIKFEIDDDKDILMVNWQVHPNITGSSTLNTISADLIASFRDEVEKECDCKVAYYSGAAGNLSWITEIADGSEGIDGISYNYDKSSAEKAYGICDRFGKALASYVITGYNVGFEDVNLDSIRIKQKETELSLIKEKNDNLYINAMYCKLIWDSSLENIAKMIEGSYNFGNDYVFPNGYDATGAELRRIVNASNILRERFIIDGNGACRLGENANVTVKNTLIKYIGATFSNRIYSPYHASGVIRNYLRNEGSTKKIELNAISIGEISFVTVPDELFDSSGKYIKDNSTSKMTFVLELTNGTNGYVPTSDCYDYGCYETDTTPFEKGSAEQITNELLNMLGNADDEPPVLTVNKILSEDKKTCLVVITSNEELQELDGWEISEDNKQLTNTFSSNGIIEVKVMDLAGNEKTETITIDSIEKSLESNTYKITNDFVRNIQTNTELSDFKNNIISNINYTVKENNNELQETDIIKTGQRLVTEDKIYAIIVDGDTNGDGIVDINDIVNINNHRTNAVLLQNEFAIAGDVNEDNVINIKDILLLNKFIHGMINSFNNEITDTTTAELNIGMSNIESIKRGDSFTITVSVKCLDGINGVLSEFLYDNTKLELIEQKIGVGYININTLPEPNAIELISEYGSITEDEIYSLTFKVKENVGDGESVLVKIGNTAIDSDTNGACLVPEQIVPITIQSGTSDSGGQNNQGNQSGEGNQGNNQGSQSGESNQGNNQGSQSGESNQWNNQGSQSGESNQGNNQGSQSGESNQGNNQGIQSKQNNNKQSDLENRDGQSNYRQQLNSSIDKDNEEIQTSKDRDVTTANTAIPQTGFANIAWIIILILIVIAVIIHLRIKKYDKYV